MENKDFKLVGRDVVGTSSLKIARLVVMKRAFF